MISETERIVREYIDFVPHIPGRWKLELQEYYEGWDPERIVGIGLIPFGHETMMDAGPVCFDTRFRQSNGDCPVVFWDHEWVESDAEVSPLFSSSVKMFECLALAARFISSDPADQLPEEQKLKQFLDIDPTGAGGKAREYWTGWFVEPAE